MNNMIRLLLTALISGGIIFAHGQDKAKDSWPNMKEVFQEAIDQMDSAQIVRSGGIAKSIKDQSSKPKPKLSEALEKKLEEAQLRYLDHEIHNMEHHDRVFSWQYLSSIVIFFFVMFLSGVGIYFSWVQFNKDKEKPSIRKNADALQKKDKPGEEKAAKAEAEAEAVVPQVTTLEFSPKGLKVSSPVLGVIILTISLAFFYLYLTFVYPITEVGGGKEKAQVEQIDKKAKVEKDEKGKKSEKTDNEAKNSRSVKEQITVFPGD